MDIISLNYSTDQTGILTGTSATGSTDGNDATAATSFTQGGDKAQFSKGAELMGKLRDLQSSDPEKFKEVAQTISDKLTEAAGNATDSNQAKFFSDMAGKFADAAKSGDMSSLTPPEKPQGGTPPQNAEGAAAMKYGQAQGASPFEQMDDILSQALSGVETASA